MKTYFQVRFIQESYRVGDEFKETIELDCYEDIVSHGQKNNMTYCEISKGQQIEEGGVEFKSEPVKQKGRIFFNARDIHTRDELIDNARSDLPEELQNMCNEIFKREPGLKSLLNRAKSQDIENLESEDPQSTFVISSVGRQVRLEVDDVVYDNTGKKIWPHNKKQPNKNLYRGPK